MQISILSGIFTDQRADFRTSYPINCYAVPLKNDISNGYLRRMDGVSARNYTGMPDGVSRGAINWNNAEYRVVGTKLIRKNENLTVDVLGDVGGSGQVTLDYSFDRLAIASGSKLFYYKNNVLTQVTDPDLGAVYDMIWVDGYFMTTDGTNLVVTELLDPTQVDPLKYGSSEADPDPVVGLIKARNEVYALNRYTIEVFNNVGGANFPFSRVEGAIIPKGAVGTYAKCKIDGSFAFIGSGRNEPCSIYVADAAQAVKIATREIEYAIQQYSESELAQAVLEFQETKVHKRIYVRLPRETWMYDAAASAEIGQPVWARLSSSMSTTNLQPFRAKDFVYVYGGWQVGDLYDNRCGAMDDSLTTQYGSGVGYQFDTQIIYNGSKGVIVNQIELVGLFGRAAIDEDPTIFVSWTNDGEIWSDERILRIGKFGERGVRPQIRQGSRFSNWRAYRVRGAHTAVASFTRFEAELEPLSYG